MPTTAAARPVVVATLMRREGATGVQSHVREVVGAGMRLGRDVGLVTPFDARSPFLIPAFAARRAIAPLSSAAGVWWYRQGHRHYLEGALRRQLRDGDGDRDAVVYAQDPVSAAAALRTRRLAPVALAVHFNVSQADEWADKGEITRGGRLFQSIRRFEREVLPAVDGLVHVSEFMRETLAEHVPATRTLPSVVAPNFLAVGPDRERGPARDLVTLGSLEPRKNQVFILEVLAAAARRGHRYTLTVVGEGPDREVLRRRARELGIDDLVDLAGFSPDPRAVLRRHRLYVHASRLESFGIALTEAMAEGLPVLAAPVGGVTEVVRPGTDGQWWSLDDPEGAAGVLVGLLEDGPRLERLGRAAREGARERFSAEVVAPRLFAFLDALESRGRG